MNPNVFDGDRERIAAPPAPYRPLPLRPDGEWLGGQDESGGLPSPRPAGSSQPLPTQHADQDRVVHEIATLLGRMLDRSQPFDEPLQTDPSRLRDVAEQAIASGTTLIESWDGDLASGRELSVAQQLILPDLREQIGQLEGQVRALQEAAKQRDDVGNSLSQQICDSITRVTVITVIGGLIGGPLLAYAVHGLVGEKMIELTIGSLVASASTEAATYNISTHGWCD